MNVYDFDKTIYNGDSTEDFIKWCIKKKPLLAAGLIGGGASFCAYKMKLCSKTHFKEKMYSFLRNIPEIDSWVEEFWDAHYDGIKKWYITRKQPDDVIISASPEFLLKPVCERLSISHLMASRVDKRTGLYSGINCFGEEKVRRYRERFSEDIDEFYSDSFSDLPLAKLAKKAFLVQGDVLIPWNARQSKQ